MLALEARRDLLGPSDLPLLRTLVGDAETWALVDPLAGGILGRLIVAHPEIAADVDEWPTDPNFWVRRAALLSQLAPLRAGHDFARFAAYADAMLDEREFFIRKAIGWVLRGLRQDASGHGYGLARAPARPRIRSDHARGDQVPPR